MGVAWLGGSRCEGGLGAVAGAVQVEGVPAGRMGRVVGGVEGVELAVELCVARGRGPSGAISCAALREGIFMLLFPYGSGEDGLDVGVRKSLRTGGYVSVLLLSKCPGPGPVIDGLGSGEVNRFSGFPNSPGLGISPRLELLWCALLPASGKRLSPCLCLSRSLSLRLRSSRTRSRSESVLVLPVPDSSKSELSSELPACLRGLSPYLLLSSRSLSLSSSLLSGLAPAGRCLSLGFSLSPLFSA